MKLRHLLSIFFLFLVVILPESVPAFALSPQASSLHDAVNYPVDGNKGAADISIPLYTVEYGGIRIPIVLRYSTSSAKVDRSVAPNVGFGWVLDVGGSINRVIKGKPDEASVWYQADSETYFDQLGSNADQYTISSVRDEHAVGRRVILPDGERGCLHGTLLAVGELAHRRHGEEHVRVAGVYGAGGV